MVADLYAKMHPLHLRLYINVPVDDDNWDFKYYAAHTDGVIVMDYDQHEPSSGPGPVAGQEWFVRNLKAALKAIPRNKLICSIGNYGYDWTLPMAGQKHKGAAKVLDVDDRAVQDAWQEASDSDASPVMDTDSLNMHFAYEDEDAHTRHEVWYLDAVTALNEMRAARELGIQTFALWRLGSEDPTLWNIWNKPMESRCGAIAVDDLSGRECEHGGRRRHSESDWQAAGRQANNPDRSRLQPGREPGDPCISAAVHAAAVRISSQRAGAEL